MRLLDKGDIPLHLTGLGFDERQSNDLIESIQMPHGLMLVTGPDRQRQEHHALRLPQPAQRAQDEHLHRRGPGRIQVQGDEPGPGQEPGRADVLHGAAGVPAARPRRHHGRRGPRPGDRADLPAGRPDRALRALDDPHQRRALGRHPACRTWASSRSCWPRPSAALEAQRLVRRLCPQCKEAYDCDAVDRPSRFGLEAGETLYRPKGCDTCRGAGYRGRVGIFEVIRITPHMAQADPATDAAPRDARGRAA